VVARFSTGAIPLALAGGLLLAHAPLVPLKRLLGVFLIAVVVWRQLRPRPRSLRTTHSSPVGAASGLGSALLGSVGPLIARVLMLGAAMTSATLAGAWVGKKIVAKISERVFVVLVETGLIAAGLLLPAGIA
jgi:uncharacterized membrane protein YfcA